MNNVVRCAHISDLHIRNLKLHREYRAVFEKLYESLRQAKPDFIVVAGDIAHTKTQISPEYVELAGELLDTLANIAPTYVILGNHDANVNNAARQDAVTPIALQLKNPNLHILKMSGETRVPGTNIVLNVLSIFDKDNWVLEPTDPKAINIALYHGSVSGCQTDQGWRMEYGDHDVSFFEEFDYAMLGDIHKTNQTMDDEGRIRYPGSTIQQNHGETADKGYLLWDIRSKDDFDVKHIHLPNPCPFVSVVLTPKGRVPKHVSVPAGSRVRLISKTNLPFDTMRRAMDVAKQRFSPQSITVLNRSLNDKSLHEFSDETDQQDLRNISVQEELITAFLKNYEAEPRVLDNVLELNRKYNTLIEADEDVMRNVHWRIRKLRWDNLFNYGSGNVVDFNKLQGVVGIFGKSYTGKSSIVDSLLWTIYNTTSKNERKNLNVVNQNRNYGDGYVEIEVGNDLYKITRKAEKYLRTLYGKTTQEARTTVDFMRKNMLTGEKESLNGETRAETDKAIRRIFGQIDDFLLTSMTHQFGALAFINEGSTKRKELFARFLDLDIFERKFKLAKEDASDTRGALKRIEGQDFDANIKAAKALLLDNKERLITRREECVKLKEDLAEVRLKISTTNASISSVPENVVNIVKAQNQREKHKKRIDILSQQALEVDVKLKNYANVLALAETDQELLNIDDLTKRQAALCEEKPLRAKAEADLRRHQAMLKRSVGKGEKLVAVPCDNTFPTCPFIRDAVVAANEVDVLQASIAELETQVAKRVARLAELDEDYVKITQHKLEQLNADIAQHKRFISDLKLSRQKIKTSLAYEKHALKEVLDKITQYEQYKGVIENLEHLEQDLVEAKTRETSLEAKLDECEADILVLVQENGSCAQRLETLQSGLDEYHRLREQYEAYDLFTRAMHFDGIASDIIRKRLPVINVEISKILANVVDFEVFFESTGKKLDIFIKHPKYAPRPLEMGSGAEKSISAMAIRLAFLSVSSLPKSNFFILDEPGTAYDEEVMDGFVRLLDLIKTYFRTVILISHLDTLKDCVDTQIIIDRKNGGYAHVAY